jgi:hypothetical protein
MNVHELVDELFRAFADRLDGDARTRGLEVPKALGLVAQAAARWGRGFGDEVTLGVPALVAQALPGATGPRVRDAVLAHMLAVIDAFAVERIEGERFEASTSLLALLGQVRRERDRALARLLGSDLALDPDYSGCDSTTVRALRRERQILLAQRPADFETYDRVVLAKQSVGAVASVGLARASGEDARRCRAVRAMVQSAAFALQIYDDVVDWEDDLQRGGAWAVCLMKAVHPASSTQAATQDEARLRLEVLRSGILRTMLQRAAAHIRASRMRAAALGALRLAAWAAARESRLHALVAAESRSAGYAVRAHALAAWAGEVLV